MLNYQENPLSECSFNSRISVKTNQQGAREVSIRQGKPAPILNAHGKGENKTRPFLGRHHLLCAWSVRPSGVYHAIKVQRQLALARALL